MSKKKNKTIFDSEPLLPWALLVFLLAICFVGLCIRVERINSENNKLKAIVNDLPRGVEGFHLNDIAEILRDYQPKYHIGQYVWYSDFQDRVGDTSKFERSTAIKVMIVDIAMHRQSYYYSFRSSVLRTGIYLPQRDNFGREKNIYEVVYYVVPVKYIDKDGMYDPEEDVHYDVRAEDLRKI
jgi:hypothetical protein